MSSTVERLTHSFLGPSTLQSPDMQYTMTAPMNLSVRVWRLHVTGKMTRPLTVCSPLITPTLTWRRRSSCVNYRQAKDVLAKCTEC